MKCIPQGSLADHLEDYADDPRKAVRATAAVARAVEFAHSKNRPHLDLKPSNILLDGDQPLVSDFGLGRRTRAYMAPEREAGVAADVFGLGATLHELLTGIPPVHDPDLKGPVPPGLLREGGLDGDLEIICLKCLRSDPQGRYASAAVLADDLERWLCGEPILARRVGIAERTVKWARRKPAWATVASLAATLIVGLVLGIFFLATLANERDVQRTLARLGEAKAHRYLRSAGTSNADQAWHRGQTERVHRVLSRDPTDGGEYDFARGHLRHVSRLVGVLAWGRSPVPLTRLTYAPDGGTLATGGPDGIIRLWDVATRKLRSAQTGGGGAILGLGYSGKVLRAVRPMGRHWIGMLVADRGRP